VRTLLLCSGRIYYELSLAPQREEATDIAIARLEQTLSAAHRLDPRPGCLISQARAVCTGCRRTGRTWARGGASNERSASRVRRTSSGITSAGLAAPAHRRGYAGSHQLEQERIVTDAFATSRRGRQLSVDESAAAVSPQPRTTRHDPARRGARRWPRRRCRRASRRTARWRR